MSSTPNYASPVGEMIVDEEIFSFVDYAALSTFDRERRGPKRSTSLSTNSESNVDVNMGMNMDCILNVNSGYQHPRNNGCSNPSYPDLADQSLSNHAIGDLDDLFFDLTSS
jgi:hypothetical protein